MCGRIVRASIEDYEEYFGISADALASRRAAIDHYLRYNIAPTQEDLIIRPADAGRELAASRWGLIPSWSKDRSIASKTFNARSETLLERSLFRGLVKAHRCIIPASGFYEWRKVGKGKQPLYLHAADDGPIALAGLWTTWTDPDSGESVTSHTVITTEANDWMRSLHTRMPVILQGEALELWLDPSVTEREPVQAVLVPPPDDALVAHEVSTQVNNVRNDGPELIQPAA
jgi:putative SOS response-associated peptidase YedK